MISGLANTRRGESAVSFVLGHSENDAIGPGGNVILKVERKTYYVCDLRPRGKLRQPKLSFEKVKTTKEDKNTLVDNTKGYVGQL